MTQDQALVLCPNPRCGSDDLRFPLQRQANYTLGGRTRTLSFSFGYCGACRLGFVHPVPEPEVVAAFYEPSYDYWQPPPEPRRSELWKTRLAASRFSDGLGAPIGRAVARFAEEISGRDCSYSLAVPASLPRTAAILDFGCGGGGYLLALRRLGFTDLCGFDLAANDRSLKRLQDAGIRTFTGAVDSLAGQTFDAIRLEHTFEHLPNPIEVLGVLTGLLRPRGRIVLTVPSIYPWEPVEALEASPHLDHMQLPIHIWHHSEKSLRDFLENAGLSVEGVRRLRPFNYLSASARRT